MGLVQLNQFQAKPQRHMNNVLPGVKYFCAFHHFN